MVVVYDEGRAMEDVCRFKQEELKRRVLVIIVAVIGLLGIAPFLLAWSEIITAKWVAPVGAGFTIISVPVAKMLASEDEQPRPSNAAKYYMASEGKKVLEVRVEERPGSWAVFEAVCLVTEDANGLVESTVLCAADYQEDAKIQEPTFDVQKGIVYSPHRRGDEV